MKSPVSFRFEATGGSDPDPVIDLLFDGTDCFVLANGMKIAQRVYKNWISLEPGWVVSYNPYGDDDMTISFQGARVH
jgi:hypothetical protein